MIPRPARRRPADVRASVSIHRSEDPWVHVSGQRARGRSGSRSRACSSFPWSRSRRWVIRAHEFVEGQMAGPDAGPVVRLYALTQGRTRPAGESPLDLIDVVMATNTEATAGRRPGPDHRRMLNLCRRPVPVADLASQTDLPIGVVRVLLGDLSQHGLIRGYRPAERGSANASVYLGKGLMGYMHSDRAR